MVKLSFETKTMQPIVKQFQIIGRAAPTERKPNPKVFRMKMSARTAPMARAKFWFFMKRICKAKKTGGEILSVTEIREKKPEKVKNFGIWLRYESRTNTHNMYA